MSRQRLSGICRRFLAASTPAQSTVINLCNHIYWNLNGVPSRPRRLPEPITNHHMQLHSGYVAEMQELIPTGSMKSVEGTPHDYKKLRAIREGMEATQAEGRDPPGYDDPVALDKWDSKLHEAGRLFSPKTGITLQLDTTSPAVVVYTANYLPENASGEAGERFQRHSGICLETQYFPNSPHIPSFPSTVVSKERSTMRQPYVTLSILRRVEWKCGCIYIHTYIYVFLYFSSGGGSFFFPFVSECVESFFFSFFEYSRCHTDGRTLIRKKGRVVHTHTHTHTL
ncbi:putative aldose 1-epimerase-like protein [Trypanosoma cruzi]|uniref:Putative aldose 1-epimerase-like protein n=1 Tax=Trypanosoma cruzi TaxID=5693 RepID=A0A2V2UV97_TRYCR|nr:putative aldose 1-epimerase-like protein [Trypanosoma cruzi]